MKNENGGIKSIIMDSATQQFRWKLRKKGRQVFNICTKFLLLGGVATSLLMATPNALANPSGGTVVQGSADITGTGTSHVNIHQHSDRTVINWDSFDIPEGHTTQFHQPSTSSIALNRVYNSNQLTTINGNLLANGQVMVINPNGLVFGATANIDTAGFIASTADIADSAFMAEHNDVFHFDIAGTKNASIINHGQISVADTGLAALVAPSVQNNGIIRANLGKVVLGAGDTFGVDLFGDGLLYLGVGESDTLESTNSGQIFADSGSVVMTAADASAVVDSVINHSGYIQARSLTKTKDGVVLLSGTDVKVSGNINATGTVEVTAKKDIDMLPDSSIFTDGGDAVLTAKNIHIRPNTWILTAGGDIEMTATDGLELLGNNGQGIVLASGGGNVFLTGATIKMLHTGIVTAGGDVWIKATSVSSSALNMQGNNINTTGGTEDGGIDVIEDGTSWWDDLKLTLEEMRKRFFKTGGGGNGSQNKFYTDMNGGKITVEAKQVTDGTPSNNQNCFAAGGDDCQVRVPDAPEWTPPEDPPVDPEDPVEPAGITTFGPVVLIDPLGRPILSYADNTLVLDLPFEGFETRVLTTDVNMSTRGLGPAPMTVAQLAAIETAAGGEDGDMDAIARQLAGIETAAGGDDDETGMVDPDIQCANVFLEGGSCEIE